MNINIRLACRYNGPAHRENLMVRMKKIMLVLGVILTLSSVACSPSKEKVCEPCEEDELLLEICEDSYDLCKDVSGCKAKTLKDQYEILCSLP